MGDNMDSEPTTEPWSRALSQEKAGKQAGSLQPPQPLLSPHPEEGAGCSVLVSPARRTSLRTEPPLGEDKMEVPKHAHTHMHRAGRTGETNTYWNCSRCHWCLMSHPLQSNQREPLQQEHGDSPVVTQHD